MNLNSFGKGVVAAATLTLASASFAAPFIPLPLAGIFEDDNIELAMGADGNIKESGALVAGDVLFAFVGFNAILNPDTSPFVTFSVGGNQISGISALQIASISAGSITFKPWEGFEDVYGSGALAALYSSNNGEFSVTCNILSPTACLNQATQSTTGGLWAVAGLKEDDDFWSATNALPGGLALDTITIPQVASLSGATKVAVANYALSVLVNNTGYNFDDQDCPLCSLIFGAASDGKAQIIGSGDVLGGEGLKSPFFARSDFDFKFAASRVPEPASLALVGIALAGLGAATRRRASKAKA